MTVRLAGEWRLHLAGVSDVPIERVLDTAPPPARITFDASALREWGSGLVAYVEILIEACDVRSIAVDRGGLPDGVRRLLDLAQAVPETEGARREVQHPKILERVGTASIGYEQSVANSLDFIGEVILAFGRMMRGQAHFRNSDLMLEIQQCGADALGIVALISYLVGIILAFMGAIQLSQFGAQIYVADLVGIGVTREMGAMMTAIIMEGDAGNRRADHDGNFAARVSRAAPYDRADIDDAAALPLLGSDRHLWRRDDRIADARYFADCLFARDRQVYNRRLHNWRTR